MAKYFSLFLLFTTMALTTTTTNLRHLSSTDSLSPAPSPSILSPLPIYPLPNSRPPVSILSPLLPPSPPTSTLLPEYIQQQQLKNIIDALIGAGDFTGWANILFNPNKNSSIPTTTTAPLIPATATLFVPGNNALSRLSATVTGAFNLDPLIIPYHILPQRFTFSELQLFKTQTRLPTLLPSKTIIITNNTPSNFTIDNSLIAQPDIYLNSAVSVHGISTILDYTIYGDAGPTPPTPLPPPPLPPADATVTPPPEFVRNYTSMCVVSAIDLPIFWFLISVCFGSIYN